MSGLHIPPFHGSPEEAKSGNRRQGLQSTPIAPGSGGMRSRTGAITIGGGRGAKKAASKDDGKIASRQLSRSYFVPRTLEGYERHLRQIQCEGYLQRRSRTSDTWRRRWFLLKDGYLSYFQDQDEAETYRSKADARLHHHPSSQQQLSLECVEAVRTEEKLGPRVFRVISSDRDDLVLQAESKEGMNDWLFGFHRALAGIIARLMETGSRSLPGGGAFQGGAGEGPPKVLGHGHGRARRLSLRQKSAKNDVEKSTIDSCQNSATTALGAESQGAIGRTNGKHHHDERARTGISPDGDRGNGGNRVGGIVPNASHERQRRVLSCSDRRKRAESMGNWAMLGFGGYGTAHETHDVGAREYIAGYADTASQATNVSHVGDLVAGDSADAGHSSERGLLSRALSASMLETSNEMSDEDELLLEKLDNIGWQRRENLEENEVLEQQEELHENLEGSLSATTDTSSGSSGEEERGVIGLGLGKQVDVTSRSMLATPAEDERVVKKTGIMGGGGGKYVPPAMRAAAAKADASLSALKKRTVGGGGKYVPPAMRAAARAEAAPSLPEAFCGSSPGMLRPPSSASSLRNGGLGADNIFMADGVSSSLATTSGTATVEPSRLPLSSGSSSYPRVVPGPRGSSCIPPHGGAGCGATFPVLPRGLVFPWAPANKEHYYTGQYHARQPCTQTWPCSETRRGIGGGPIPTKTSFSSLSRCYSDGLGEGFAMDDDGVADLGLEGQGFEVRGLWWTCGAWSIMGRREKQEDRFCAMPDYTKSITGIKGGCRTTQQAASQGAQEGSEGNAQGYFAVYDGHCGSEAVQFVRDRLHTMVGEQSCFWKEPKGAIRKAFLSIDDEFLALAGENDWYSGTTALVALMRGRKLLVGNLGDGEAVLCRKGEAVHMSPVHSPARPDENKRIQEANGWVTTEKELYVRQLKQMDLDDPEIRMAATESVKWNTITRVCGELAVSRSIGDRDFKGFTKRRIDEGMDGVVPQEATLFSWPKGHSGKFSDDLVTADPEFIETEIEEDDHFLLMACDGLWDVLRKSEAVSRARHMFDEGLCAQAVAERMCELAYRMGTSDNVTVVVVQFHHSRPC